MSDPVWDAACRPDNESRDLALIRAGLEAAAKECIEEVVERNGNKTHRDACVACAAVIRALSPKSILEELKGVSK